MSTLGSTPYIRSRCTAVVNAVRWWKVSTQGIGHAGVVQDTVLEPERLVGGTG